MVGAATLLWCNEQEISVIASSSSVPGNTPVPAHCIEQLCVFDEQASDAQPSSDASCLEYINVSSISVPWAMIHSVVRLGGRWDGGVEKLLLCSLKR